MGTSARLRPYQALNFSKLGGTTRIDFTQYLHSLSQHCSQYLRHLEIAVWSRALFQECSPCMPRNCCDLEHAATDVTTIFWYDPIFLSTLQRSGGWKISRLYGARWSTSALALACTCTHRDRKRNESREENGRKKKGLSVNDERECVGGK